MFISGRFPSSSSAIKNKRLFSAFQRYQINSLFCHICFILYFRCSQPFSEWLPIKSKLRHSLTHPKRLNALKGLSNRRELQKYPSVLWCFTLCKLEAFSTDKWFLHDMFFISTWRHKMIWGKKPCSRRTVRPQCGRICVWGFHEEPYIPWRNVVLCCSWITNNTTDDSSQCFQRLISTENAFRPELLSRRKEHAFFCLTHRWLVLIKNR